MLLIVETLVNFHLETDKEFKNTSPLPSGWNFGLSKNYGWYTKLATSSRV